MLAFLWGLAKVTIPVPLAVLVAGGVWFQVDKSSSVRRAISSAVKELVAGSEIKAAEARAKALTQLIDFQKKRADEAEASRVKEESAKSDFETRMLALDDINDDLNRELNEMLSKPVNVGCNINADLYRRLRNK